MKLKFLGACNEVGRSGVLIETDKKIITDYGVKIRAETVEKYLPVHPPADVDMLVITHAHLDHSGGAPFIRENTNATIVTTPPTRDLVKLLLKDNIKIMGRENLPYSMNAYKQTINKMYTTPYNRKMKIGETDITLVDAGHITGSAMVKIEYKNKTLLYTGDYNTIDSQLHKGTKFDEHVDYLITESTYGNREHPDRRKTELEFVESIKEVLDNKGNVLVPAFAVDRTQEVLSVIRKHIRHAPVYMDGMNIDASEIMLKYPKYVSNYNEFVRALKTVNLVTSNRTREEAVSHPSIISTSGMLSGGPALSYLHSLPPNSAIFLAGYCVEETNGWYLMNKGYIMQDGMALKVGLPWKYFDFSAHIDHKHILKFLKKVSPEKVFTVHGDDTKGFAEDLKEQGYDAVGPDRGQKFEL